MKPENLEVQNSKNSTGCHLSPGAPKTSSFRITMSSWL